MGRVAGRNTRPEMIVRRLVHGLGFRYRLHVRTLPGCPDLVLTRHRRIVFVHGCFWHGHPGCRRAARPVSNTEFWNRKLDRTATHDALVAEQLNSQGWRVMVVWECEVRDRTALLGRLAAFLGQREESIGSKG